MILLMYPPLAILETERIERETAGTPFRCLSGYYLLFRCGGMFGAMA